MYLPSDIGASSEGLLTALPCICGYWLVRVLLEVIGANEKHQRSHFLHQLQFLVLNHRLMPLCYLLVVLQIDKLLERAQILVQITFDLNLSRLEARFVLVIELGKTEVGFNLVDSLLEESAALLAHNVEEEEL